VRPHDQERRYQEDYGPDDQERAGEEMAEQDR